MTKTDFEQLTQQARDANLVDYFSQSGYTVQKHGDIFYVKEYPGLCLKPSTSQWYNHYGGYGGTNAIDCLLKVCEHDFKQAIYELTGNDLSSARSTDYPKNQAPQFTSPPKTVSDMNVKKELVMPDKAENMRRVFAYFCKERKIPADIIEELAHAKLLYQSHEKILTNVNGIMQISNPQNAVFVHRDENGVAVGGEAQGVNSYRRYKGLVAGTGDSAFIFTPYPASDGKPKTAYLFESAIDLMSFYALCKREKMQGVMLVSMAGLKPAVPKQLETQGVKIYSCVDNDDAGRKFEADNGFKRGTDMLEKAGVKDFNDLLKVKIENPNAVKDFVPDVEKKNLFEWRKVK